jgi:NAD(P)H dehydrogenase (quinone)
MSIVAIVYHSGFGHTERLARAVERGARSVPNAQVHLIPVSDVEARWTELDAADAIVFGAPTYMGSASAPFKAFLDATSGRWMKQSWKDKLAAGFTNSGSPSGDKFNTLVEMATTAAQHGMIWVSLGLLPRAPGAGGLELNRAGFYLGAGTQSPHGAAQGDAPPAGDLATGEALGARVASLAARWSAGRRALAKS